MTQRKLTVLQILPALNSGGVERGTLEVAAELVKLGHRSIVISSGGKLVSELISAGSEHIQWSIDKKSLFTIRWIKPLRRLLRDRNIDILHVRSRVPAWVAYLAWRGMNPTTRPGFVTTVHGLYSVNRYSAVMTKGQRVIAISEFVRQYIIDNYPKTDPTKIRLIHRGADPDKFPRNYKPSQTWLNTFYSQYPQLKNNSVITLPGRITRYKGHHDFIQLMANLQKLVPNAQGLIVGAEDKKRRKYANEIHQHVKAEGLTNIIFTGHRADVREIYALSDVVICCSSNPPEAFGRTVIEALSIGTSVVGYDQSGAGEIIAQLLPEGVIQMGNIGAMTQRVAEFLENKPTVSENRVFTTAILLDKTLAVYHELADKRSADINTD